MRYDIPERPLDPPEDVVFATCDHCGGEIYEGEEFYDIDGEFIHEDCLHDWARFMFTINKRTADSSEYVWNGCSA